MAVKNEQGKLSSKPPLNGVVISRRRRTARGWTGCDFTRAPEEFTGSLLAGGEREHEREHAGAPRSNDSGPRQPIASLSEVALHQMAYDYSIGIMTVLVRAEEEEEEEEEGKKKVCCENFRVFDIRLTSAVRICLTCLITRGPWATGSP